MDHLFLLLALLRERGNRLSVARLGRMMIPFVSLEEIYRIFSFILAPTRYKFVGEGSIDIIRRGG